MVTTIDVPSVETCSCKVACKDMTKKNKKIAKKRSLTFRFLYYWAKVTCINPLILSNSDELRISYLSAIYAIVLTVVCSYVTYYIWLNRVEAIYPGKQAITIITIAVVLINKFLETVYTWFIFGFHQNRIKLVVHSFMKVEKTSTKLDININYEKSFRRLATFLTFITVVYTSLVVTFNSSNSQNGIVFDAFLWLGYAFPQISTVSVWTIFIWIVAIVKRKFQGLNDRLRLLVESNYPNYNCIFLDDEIKFIARLHRELRDVIYRTVQHVSVCILSDILNQFLSITHSAYIGYSIFSDYSPESVMDRAHITAIFSWMFISIGILAIISNVCGSAIDEANETRKILHAVLNNINNFGEIPSAANFNVMSLDLIQNQLKISLLGFIDLDHYLVFRAITTAITILTIMLQF